jgi:hypothetical protein
MPIHFDVQSLMSDFACRIHKGMPPGLRASITL